MIFINDIPSFRNPESSELKFDDRIEKVELIGGNTVQDYGYIASGDTFSLTCLFSYSNYLSLKELWSARASVTYTDEAGATWQNLRLVFKSIKRDRNFPNYVLLTFELWRI